MRATRLTVLVFALPIAAFIGLLVLVTALWIHPPTIGWIGLAVVALVSIALGVAGYVLFPRMSVNADPVAAPERARLLVLADASAPVADLCDTVVVQLAGRDAEVLVVAPVLPPPSHYVANDEEAARAAAEERLEDLVAGLRSAGLAASGRVGTDDPLQALGDALAEFPAAEVLIVTAGEAVWLERGLFERARGFAPVVQHVEARTPATV
jgi:hypothetical protein